MEFTVEELNLMPNQDPGVFCMYENVPKGYVCKITDPYNFNLFFNPDTSHVLIYHFREYVCYVDSSTDKQYNGGYKVYREYTAK